MTTPITIAKVIASPGIGGFFFDDQTAIKAGAIRDGATYKGTAVTPGFKSVREPSESVSVLLVLSDGYIAQGDCASVQYTGVGGREPRFHARELATQIEQELGPRLVGMQVNVFRKAALEAEALIDELFESKRATAYGVSQALLNAAAHAAGHHLMAQVIKDEWNIAAPLAAVPIYGQSGDDRYTNVDKMIMKSVEVLPHGLINTPELVGVDGIAIEEYIGWLRARISQLRVCDTYQPIIHLDVYGLIGAEAKGSLEHTANIIQRLERAAGPHELRLEHPIDAGSRDAQIETMAALRQILKTRGSRVSVIADEWANTVEDVHLFAVAGATDMVQIKTPDLGSIHNAIDAIIDCQKYGIGPVLGGTCAETDQSARVTAHIGIATAVSQMLAKPGMGFDEGYNIVFNEMNRALRIAEARSNS
ncbi:MULTISPECIES: methylaspartate ammonia-lyase [Pseudomonas]|uniref:methylaspartate ammonia-lyase n=1 Tax=Pseudomonas salomonii TaxID=191391 RepID=A0ABS9GVE7_9PSED|nr:MULTISPECIES: methylaspartate ammonia-lyase [Pseudomonas]AVJ38306.1 methylaspartate ammonia-lyase [Pseudomonas lurida]MCF5548527.1 methylaspartate ammonia-lyase [Pseudomonas salomonii]PRA17792.1 methylaspartate ammonia-lyase [Pseudomonas sp. MYb13]PRA20927.1 methylaspartate ammonia-lyase [Pseudomonas lurida]PRA37658.1 methylaspartate ammonia-lyase [Pseudomonas lurida]